MLSPAPRKPAATDARTLPFAAAVLLALFLLCASAGYQWTTIRQAVRLLTDPFNQRQWQLAEARKAALPRFAFTAAQNATALPVLVLSLPRLAERRQHVNACMAAQGIAFQFVSGVDGSEPLPQPLASVYSSPRWQGLIQGGDHHMALKLSHLLSCMTIFHKLVADQLPYAVVLEDDACVSLPGWMERVKGAMRQLPDDWDVFYLSAVSPVLGRFVGTGVRVIRKTAGTGCFVVNQRFAFKIFQGAAGADDYIDKVMFHMEWRHKLQAYVAEPSLCDVGLFASSLGYKAPASGDTNQSAVATGGVPHGLMAL